MATQEIKTAYRALAMRVLVAANFNLSVGDWGAYCDAVPGERHDREYQAVLDHGSKIPEPMAEMLFGGILEMINERRENQGLEPMYYRY